jgi:hypothetical protein
MSLSPPLSTSSNSTSLRSPLGAMSASSASPSLLTPPPTICDPSRTPSPLQTKEHPLTVVVDEGIIDPGWAGYRMRYDKWDSESEPDLGHWDEVSGATQCSLNWSSDHYLDRGSNVGM